MSRTLSDLRTLMTEFMVLDLDNSKGESPTSPNQNEQLNWAYRSLAMRASLFDPSITLTLTASQRNYDLRSLSVVSKKVIVPKWVYINNVPLRTCDQEVRGLWTIQELERENSSWRTGSSGVPTKAILLSYGTLMLDPAPTAAVVSSGNNYIAGTYLPSDMDDDSDLPEIPEEFHELIAYQAAIKASLPVVTEEEMWNRIKAYDAEIESSFKEFCRLQKTRLADWGTKGARAEYDYIWA